MSPTVFVSGATGFIAQHLIKSLLASKYQVVGSVRSAAKGDHLKTLFGSGFEYEVVSDLVKSGAFDQALINHPDVEIFFHTASPFSFGSEDFQKDMIDPALEGTLNALKAVQAHGKNVKRFVLTASYVNLFSIEKGEVAHVTEESWNPITPEEALSSGFAAYVASKTFGEKAAWKYVEEQKPHFTFATVLPPFVFGPQAFDSEVKEDMNFSTGLVTQFLKLKSTDELPQLRGGYIDVRDVAKAHITAGESEAAAGHRLGLNGGVFVAQSILNVIRKNFPQLQDTLPVGDPASEAEALKNSGSDDFAKSNAILKLDYITLDKSVTDTVSQVLQHK